MLEYFTILNRDWSIHTFLDKKGIIIYVQQIKKMQNKTELFSNLDQINEINIL